MRNFPTIFYEVTALGQRRSVRGHSCIHEYIQFDLLFQRTYYMHTFLQIVSEVTALGRRLSVTGHPLIHEDIQFYVLFQTICHMPTFLKTLLEVSEAPDLLKKMSYHL